MKKKILSLSLVIITLCTIFSFTLTPKVEAATIYGYGFSYKPIPVYADASFSSTYIQQLQQAINAWNSAGAGPLLTYAGTMNNVLLVGSGIGVTKIAQSSSQVASTMTTSNGSNITRAIVSLNSNYTYNNGVTSNGQYYLKSVFMHELGHALGLDDNYNSSSVMYAYYTGILSISSSDLSDINALYN